MTPSSGYLAIWSSGYLAIWLSGYLPSGYLAICHPVIALPDRTDANDQIAK
jgi:hypothetical protein